MPGRTQASEIERDWSAGDLLQSYEVSKNGFLPGREPLKRLSCPYYAPWETVLDDLPSLIKTRAIREAINDISVLSISKLCTEEEWRRAYVVLSFLANAYIWGGQRASEVLPPSISAPYLQVSEHLDLPPVPTYAALNLWNFACSGPDPRKLDSLHALHTFSGTEDESWFFSVSVAMEAEGAYIIPVMVRALELVRSRYFSTIAKSLDEMSLCIGRLGKLLDRMDEKCDPMVFYHQIRPLLAGSKNMGAAGLPNGVLYEDEHGARSWKQLRGGSNGQSSLVQFFDVVLGIEHTSSGGIGRATSVGGSRTSEPMSFHEEVRSYMPARHREFLEHVSHMGSLKELVSEPATSDEHMQLKRSFHAATKALGDFRNRHMQIVSRYIIVPSRKQFRGSTVNLATASSPSSRALGGELTGTGGTALVPFLRQTRDETYVTGTVAFTN
ncbi:indoleamine 2,3-dioxygenase [Hypoxylon sp. FL1284]|nr:indoleamine 2,3-dioxygenase [Hypoxylon sp. FL1284]